MKREIRYAYHLVETANWPSIEHHGLLSTAALLSVAGVTGRERDEFMRRHRPEQVILPNGVVIRDQRPMSPARLKQCLIGSTPEEWYALLNSKVFFWLAADRLNSQRHAGHRHGGASDAVVMIIDAEKLLAHHGERAALSPFNTGAAFRKPAPRNHGTFVPYGTWLETGWASEARALGKRTRRASHQPVELTVADAVPDVLDFLVERRHLPAGETFIAIHPDTTGR